MKKKKIGKIVYTIIILGVLGVGGLFTLTALPIDGNIEIKIVKSGSMEPAIDTGGIVVIKPKSSYRVGEVITFGEDNRTSFPTTHRIVGISNAGSEVMYQTKGDNNEDVDPQLVHEREVIGKVIFDVPYAGFILDFVRQPLGFTLLIALPAALVIFNELIDIFKEMRGIWRRKSDDPESKIEEKVWRRVNQMDDVLRPVISTIPIPKERNRSSAIVSTLMLLVLGLTSIRPGETISYFADNENSTGNTISAISFEIEAFAYPLKSNIGDFGNPHITSGVTFNNTNLPNEYTVRVEQADGSEKFCQILYLNSTSTPPFTYGGPLLEFVSAPTSFVGEWDFEVRFGEKLDGVKVGDICMVNLVYTAKTWLEDKGFPGGYSDIEKVTLIFELGRPNVAKDIVITPDAIATNTDSVVVEQSTSTPDVFTEKIEEEITEEIEKENATSTDPASDDLITVESGDVTITPASDLEVEVSIQSETQVEADTESVSVEE